MRMFFLVALLSFSACASFTTVTISSTVGRIEARRQVIANFCVLHGYLLSASQAPIRGYDRYASDPRNRLVRSWERATDYPTIYEFWREDDFVVLIDMGDSGRRLANDAGGELKQKLRTVDPSMEVVVRDRRYLDLR